MTVKMVAVTMGLILGLSASALAVDEPENVIKYRQSVMKAMGGHAAAIAGVVKGEVSYVDHVAAHARGIHEMSKLVPGLFPEGTSQFEFANTRALPEIWDQRAKFEAATKELKAQSAKLVEVAGRGDVAEIGAQLLNLGKACGGCHKPFRAEQP